MISFAKQEVDAHERLVLSNRDRDLIMSVMENPPELKGKLKSAVKKYRAKYGERSPEKNACAANLID